MNRDQIKLKHCYSMTPVNGRRTIARVTNLFKITAMAANKEHEIETLELNPTVVRFVWRHIPLTRQDARGGSNNSCSMILHWLRKSKLAPPS